MSTCCLRIRSAAIAALAFLCFSSAVTAQGAATADSARRSSSAGPRRTAESRDDWQRVPDIFNALGVRPGGRIADLGAGEGYLTTRLARQVGPAGRVFAVDISESALQRLAEAISDSLPNVELIRSEADDPRLPYASLDGVVILNAYHEMTERRAILDGVKRGLRPDGVVVIVDNAPTDSTAARERQTANHTLSIDLAEDDLRAAGFEIVKRVPDFVVRMRDRRSDRQWMVVARPARK